MKPRNQYILLLKFLECEDIRKLAPHRQKREAQ